MYIVRLCTYINKTLFVKYHHRLGNQSIMLYKFLWSHNSPSGVIINSNFRCLGASPDGAVYDDPSNLNAPYGFLEIVKCPYACRNVTLIDACR